MESSDSLSKSDRFNIGLYLQIALTKYLARAVIKARWFIIGRFSAITRVGTRFTSWYWLPPRARVSFLFVLVFWRVFFNNFFLMPV